MGRGQLSCAPGHDGNAGRRRERGRRRCCAALCAAIYRDSPTGKEERWGRSGGGGWKRETLGRGEARTSTLYEGGDLDVCASRRLAPSLCKLTERRQKGETVSEGEGGHGSWAMAIGEVRWATRGEGAHLWRIIDRKKPWAVSNYRKSQRRKNKAQQKLLGIKTKQKYP